MGDSPTLHFKRGGILS